MKMFLQSAHTKNKNDFMLGFFDLLVNIGKSDSVWDHVSQVQNLLLGMASTYRKYRYIFVRYIDSYIYINI